MQLSLAIGFHIAKPKKANTYFLKLTLFIVFNQLSFIVTVFFIISFAGDVEMDNSAENSEQFEDADK